MIHPATLPDGRDDIRAMLIPALQGRGLSKTEYEGETLWENLKLEKPPNRYTRACAKSKS